MTDSARSLTIPAVALLPASRFFVRFLPLAPGGSMARQVELALESWASFPVSQLYYGYLPTPRGDAVLIFAAIRKRFTNAETSGWSDATAVLPAFLGLLGQAPLTPLIRLWTNETEMVALAWNGRDPLPAVVMARETDHPADPGQPAGLIEQIRLRAELPDAGVQEYFGPVMLSPQALKGRFEFTVKGKTRDLLLSVTRAGLETADVRDKDFLTSRQTAHKRDTILWRGFQACLAGLAGLLVVEGGLWAATTRVASVKEQVKQQSPVVQKIETAQSLSRRIEEMTQRQLLPFEMLALANQHRPASVQFLRSVTNGLHAMEVEAQTTNAVDVSQYESALRTMPEIASVEIRDLRSRDGVTAFVLVLGYKPELIRPEGAR